LAQGFGRVMSEKLCLKWNDFQDNINTAFGSLRNEHDFSDVTLACEDGEQMEAHQVILAASSPFFRNLLRKNKHPHPLVYMRGIKSEDLVAILDFLYFGEANVYQENIDAFLAIAEELNLKGLTGNKENHEPADENIHKLKPGRTTSTPKVSHLKTERLKRNYEKEIPPLDMDVKPTETAIAVQNQTITVNITDVQELDEKVKSLRVESQNSIPTGPNGSTKAHICTICGKEGRGKNIMDHIESNHLEGVSIPCDLCGKTFRSRNSLGKHKRLVCLNQAP